jgi:hypothetical protein
MCGRSLDYIFERMTVSNVTHCVAPDVLLNLNVNWR